MVSFRILSYNIAYNNNELSNISKLADYISENQFDLVLLQEVVDRDYHGNNPYVILATKLSGTYQFSELMWTHHQTFDCFVLAKRATTSGQFFVHELVHENNNRRHAVTFFGTVKSVPIVITTAHLASRFFTKQFTQQKADQLKQVQEIQEDIVARSGSSGVLRLLMGDTNLTGGPMLVDENRAVSDAGWEDAWKTWKLSELGVAPQKFDHMEWRQNILSWKNDHATWRSDDNPNIRRFGNPSVGENHRPDRLLIATSSTPLVESVQMDIVKQNFSDHDGLAATLYLAAAAAPEQPRPSPGSLESKGPPKPGLFQSQIAGHPPHNKQKAPEITIVAVRGPRGWYLVATAEGVLQLQKNQRRLSRWEIDYNRGWMMSNDFYLDFSSSGNNNSREAILRESPPSGAPLQIIEPSKDRIIIGKLGWALDFWDPHEPDLKVLPRNGHDNQTWTIEQSSLPAGTGSHSSSSGGGAEFKNDAHLGAEAGANADDNIYFQGDRFTRWPVSWKEGVKVYFCSSSQAPYQNPQERVPALLLTLEYFEHLRNPSTTHEGAFGQEYTHVRVGTEQFILSWKWPADMFNFYRTGLHPNWIRGVPLPVGKYALWVDQGTPEPTRHPPPSVPLQINSNVRKWRIFDGQGANLHYLADVTGEWRCAAVASGFIFSDLWKRHGDENERANLLCATMKVFGLEVFSCHDQHHVFVFYLLGGELCTPELFAELLHNNETVSQVMEEFGIDPDWPKKYRQMFQKKKKNK